MKRVVLLMLCIIVESAGLHTASAMENYSDTLRNQYGRGIGGATVSVYIAGTTTLATLYSDNGGTAKENPFLTDVYTGQYNFYSANGVYDIVYRFPNTTFDNAHTKRISLFDSTAGTTSSALSLAANGTNCPTGQAASGVDAAGNAEDCFTPAGGGGGVGTIGGGTGSTDNAVLRADGTGGVTIQNSQVTIDDSGVITAPGGIDILGTGVGSLTFLKGTPPAGADNPGESLIYVDGVTNRFATWDNGGSAKDYVTTADIQTLTGKTVDVEASGNTIIYPVRRWIPAAGCNNVTAASVWDLPTSAAATPACVTGTNIQKGVLQFPDTAGGFSAQITDSLPVDWTTSGGVDIDLYWTSSATTGVSKWSVSTACTLVNTSSTDDPAFNAANTTTSAVPATPNRVNTASLTGLTITGCNTATKMLLHIKVFRDGGDAADTIGATANLIGAMLTFRRAM